MDANTSIANLKDLVEEFVSQRDWAQFHNPKNLSMSVAIEAAELMELFQWHDSTDSGPLMTQAEIRQAATEELADVIIYCLSFANDAEIDISEAVKSKIERNREKYPADKYRGRF